jgi:hypothetical protein
MTTLIELWAALGHATGVTRSANVYAATSALHVFGIALLVGPIVLVDLRWLGRLYALDAAAVAILRRTARTGVALTVLTGVLLASTRPAEYLANRVFLAKMAVIAIAVANALLFEWRSRRGAINDTAMSLRATAIVSLSLWLLALALGRWIAFV